MENKYLVYQTEHFYDGHGEEADGRSEWMVASEEDGYQNTNPDLRYSDELEEYDELYEQDGYHCRAYSFEVVKLSPEKAELAEQYLDKIQHFKSKLATL